jgi:quercetin dioxygenase-like cupin family protein
MNRKQLFAVWMLTCILSATTITLVHAQMSNMPDHVMVLPGDLKWGDAPPTLPAGAKMAVLDGNPGGSGLFTIRLTMPDGYIVNAHFHPTDENILVLKGNFMMGIGDKFDEKGLKPMPEGGFMSMKAGTHHYAKCKGETVIQLYANAPFIITYVNPADDPSKKATK